MHGYIKLAGVTYRWQLGLGLIVGQFHFVPERVSERVWRLARAERGVELEAYVQLTANGLAVLEDLAPVAPKSSRRLRCA